MSKDTVIAIGTKKIVWKCFHCRSRNESDLDEEEQEVPCFKCGRIHSLWVADTKKGA